jgi:sulfhydrogenase subunit alpha
VNPDEYPILEGRIGSNRGLDIGIEAFSGAIRESQVAHSNALHAHLADGAPYMVGPLARYANNHDRLPEACRRTAREAGLGPVERNPFKSILVRMIEVQFACLEALRLAQSYVAPSPACIEAPPRAGEGFGCTEAPRGICHHGYVLDDDGTLVSARIVPPTSQNQPQIEADLARTVLSSLDLDDDALRQRCEQAIRNYDPCISCATHFLKLTVDRA